jgi:peptidyl-prolyl cis-trans isomerase SurA
LQVLRRRGVAKYDSDTGTRACTNEPDSMTQRIETPFRRVRAAIRSSAVGLALAVCSVLGLVAPTTPAAFGQQVQRIAAVVNDEVISIYDVGERIDLLISSSGLQNTREQRQRLASQVLRSLIDERLQSQEAKRLNVQVTKRDLDNAIARIEETNRIPKGKFPEFLKQRGVSEAAAMKQIEAELAWQKLLARRVLPTIEIGEEEIDAVIARINATRDTEQFRVSEILLTADNPGEQAQVRELANRLVDQLRGGAEFAAVARQFSKSATAATGGDIGWVQEGQLEVSAFGILKTMQPGDVSDPAETADGLVIYKLVAKRQNAAAGADDQEIALRQIVMQLARDATEADIESKIQQARQIGSAVQGCDNFVESASQLGFQQPAEPTRIRVGDLNDTLRRIIADLDVGQASEPTRSAAGIQVVMVCERGDSAGPSREEIRDVLVRQRIDLRARRYLRDLRRAAFVDLRV